MEEYEHLTIKDKVKILKQLHVWSKMSKTEKNDFRNCADEHYADRLMRSYRSKYLM